MLEKYIFIVQSGKKYIFHPSGRIFGWVQTYWGCIFYAPPAYYKLNVTLSNVSASVMESFSHSAVHRRVARDCFQDIKKFYCGLSQGPEVLYQEDIYYLQFLISTLSSILVSNVCGLWPVELSIWLCEIPLCLEKVPTRAGPSPFTLRM